MANEEDSWAEPIGKYLIDLIKSEGKRSYTDDSIIICRTSALDIWENALGGTKASSTKAISGRINSVMKHFSDWKYMSTVRINGRQGRGFVFRLERSKLDEYMRLYGEYAYLYRKE